MLSPKQGIAPPDPKPDGNALFFMDNADFRFGGWPTFLGGGGDDDRCVGLTLSANHRFPQVQKDLGHPFFDRTVHFITMHSVRTKWHFCGVESAREFPDAPVF